MPHTTILKSFELPSNRALNVGDCKGLWLRATRGVAWITIAGIVEDIFLSAGQSCHIEHSGAVVMEALNGPAGVETGRQILLQTAEPRHHRQFQVGLRTVTETTPAQ